MNVSTVVSIAAVCLAAGALVTAMLALQAARRWRTCCESLESSFAGLRRELEMVASISARTGRRVQRVEHEYSGVADRVEMVESRNLTSAPPAAGALDEAIEWARGGADAAKLSLQFGISPGEAELVARLYGRLAPRAATKLSRA